jgi:hypothetical protein
MEIRDWDRAADFNTEVTEFAESAEKSSDKEIEKDEEEAEKEKDGAAIDGAAREAADRANNGSGDGFEAGVFAWDVEGPDDGITGEVAAEDGKFILKIDEEIAAVAPDERGTQGADEIAENCKRPERRACSPIHQSSQAAHTNYAVGRLGQPNGYWSSWMVMRRTTSNSFLPAGVATSISSPTLRLRSALPMGELVEMRPFSTSAS